MPRKILTAAIISLLALVFFSGPAALPEPEKPLPQITWQQIVLDPPPLPAGEHILVAAEDFLSLGGGSAGWQRDKGVLRGSKVATVTPGDRVALIDGTPRLLDTAPVMTGDGLYIPLGLALEVLGMSGGGRVPYPSPGQNPGWEGDPTGSGRPIYLPAPQFYT
ncbi:MAG: hypothetical protein H5T99_01375, partial [Moorella sp. (in: Bacteria)]|nr:hypothetical protein [Moorella sp. (in: firmicutes)]